MEDLIEHLTPDSFEQLPFLAKLFLAALGFFLFWFICAYIPRHWKK
jgi:hypothetical protein